MGRMWSSSALIRCFQAGHWSDAELWKATCMCVVECLGIWRQAAEKKEE